MMLVELRNLYTFVATISAIHATFLSGFAIGEDEFCVDKIDRRILMVMQEYPDLPTAEIAEIVGLSNTPCWRRIKKLEADGVIAGRAVF